jgi:hypothetical protein
MNYFPRRSTDDPDVKVDISNRVVTHIVQLCLATALATGFSMYVNEQLIRKDLDKLQEAMLENRQKIEDLQRMVWAHVGDGTHGNLHPQP